MEVHGFDNGDFQAILFHNGQLTYNCPFSFRLNCQGITVVLNTHLSFEKCSCVISHLPSLSMKTKVERAVSAKGTPCILAV